MSNKSKFISATEFKTHCLRIMDEVKKFKWEIIVTKRGKPVIKVIAADFAEEPAYGCMRGTAVIKGDIYSTGEVWDAAR